MSFKNLLFFLIAGFVSFTSLSQEFRKSNKLYGQFGVEGGSYGGVSLGVNYLFWDDFTAQFSYHFLVSSAEEKPNNFQASVFDYFTLGASAPWDAYNVFQLTGGKNFKLGPTSKTFLSLKGGFAYASYTYATNFERVDFNFFNVTYVFDREKGNLFFAVVHPSVEIPLSATTGISLGLVGRFSDRDHLYGLSFAYVFLK